MDLYLTRIKGQFKRRRRRFIALGPAFLLLPSTCAGSDAVVDSTPAATSQISKWCMIGNTRVHYVDSAVCQSGGSLLIVHGFLGSTVSFLTLIDAVSPDIRVVMPDLPAFGDSGVPECACTMEYYLDFLDAFTRAVGLDRCFLMGTSMGANIAAHYTAQHQEQVRGLLFLSPFGLQDQAGRMSQIKRWDALLPMASTLITRRGVQRWLQRSIQNKDRVTPELIDAYWKPFTTPEGRRAAVEVTRQIVGRCPMNGQLPGIRQPVLILIGSEDKLVNPEDRVQLRALLANEQLEIIEHSGHFLYLDSPDVVSNKIVRFTRGGR